jgi:uncharacterized membrane protein
MQGKISDIVISILTTVFAIPAVYIFTTFSYWVSEHSGVFPMLTNIPFFTFYIAWAVMALCAGGIVYCILRKISNRSMEHTIKQNPLDIAKTRYAKGEITKNQFKQIKKDISE